MSSRSSSNAGGSRRSGRSSPLYERDVEASDDTYLKLNNSYSPSSASSTSTQSQADPGEAIQFSQLSVGGTNRRSLSPKSRQSSASPTPEQTIPQHVVQSRGGGPIQWPQDRNYSFLAGHPSITSTESTVPKETNDKLMQLKKRKESKEKKKDRNVKSSFVSIGPENLDIDKFLESIGEKVDKKKKSNKDKKGLNGADKSGQPKSKNRKVTAAEPIQGESSVKNDGKCSLRKNQKGHKADPDITDPTPSLAPPLAASPASKVEDDSHKVQDVGKYRNAVVVQADLKRRNSAENLTSDAFTKVTSKKQKWKKKSPSADEQPMSASTAVTSATTAPVTTNNSQSRPNSSTSSNNRSRNNYNGSKSLSRTNQGQQQQNFRNNHQEISRTSSAGATSDVKKDKDTPEQTSPALCTSPSSSTSTAPEIVKMFGDLDLVADFPPLDSGGSPKGRDASSASVPATSASTTPPSESSVAAIPSSVASAVPRAWPSVGHPASNIPQQSDLSAVIQNTKHKASEKTVNPSSSTIHNVPSNVESTTAAQKMNGDASSTNSYSSALMAKRFSRPPPSIPPPDVAGVARHQVKVTMPDVTVQLPPPISGTSSMSNSGQNTPKSNKVCYLFDDKKVDQLYNNDRAYNPGAGLPQSQPAVTICGQGGGEPVDDWSTTDGGGFEFGGPVNGDLVSMGAMPPRGPGGDETLSHMDAAIVGYGERLDENQHINAAGGGELIWNHKQHNNVVQKSGVNGNGNSNEDEGGEGVGGSESWPSGRTTPGERPLPPAPSAVDQVNRPSKQSNPDLNLNFNYEDIVAFIHNEWLQVTKMHNIEYYTPSNNSSSRNRAQGQQRSKN